MTAENPVQCRRFVVRGKVQGVFFRASTRDFAQRLGLTGHAINLPDGSVEVLVCGESAALASLHGWLHQGPPRARVDSVDELPAQPAAPQSFTTR